MRVTADEATSTYAEARTELTRDRHAGRIGFLTPDPQLISRRLMSRPPPPAGGPDTCRDGQGLPGNDVAADCPYKPAPFFNAIAAFWIQFMTHDWFSHLDEARNTTAMMPTGCTTQPLRPDHGNPRAPTDTADLITRLAFAAPTLRPPC